MQVMPLDIETSSKLTNFSTSSSLVILRIAKFCIDVLTRLKILFLLTTFFCHVTHEIQMLKVVQVSTSKLVKTIYLSKDRDMVGLDGDPPKVSSTFLIIKVKLPPLSIIVHLTIEK